MKEEYIDKPKAISRETTYPDGANSPTYIIKYKCMCGEGLIEEERVPGFGDHFITLTCKKCLRKYHSIIDQCGDEFILYKKK